MLLKCFAGCSLPEILLAARLTIGDLFVDGAPSRNDNRKWQEARQRFAESPRRTVREALDTELGALRTRIRAENGRDVPIRSRDVDGVRERARKTLRLDISALPPVAPFPWECPPHDDDLNWPVLYMRALEEETQRRWHALNRDAQAWETDPNGPSLYDHLRAERLARKWQQGMTA